MRLPALLGEATGTPFSKFTSRDILLVLKTNPIVKLYTVTKNCRGHVYGFKGILCGHEKRKLSSETEPQTSDKTY